MYVSDLGFDRDGTGSGRSAGERDRGRAATEEAREDRGKEAWRPRPRGLRWRQQTLHGEGQQTRTGFACGDALLNRGSVST